MIITWTVKFKLTEDGKEGIDDDDSNVILLVYLYKYDDCIQQSFGFLWYYKNLPIKKMILLIFIMIKHFVMNKKKKILSWFAHFLRSRNILWKREPYFF